MALSQGKIEEHAERIGREILENAEFCFVYEDEKLQDVSEEDQRKIFDAIQDLHVEMSSGYL